jgi:hypothetical protein
VKRAIFSPIQVIRVRKAISQAVLDRMNDE